MKRSLLLSASFALASASSPAFAQSPASPTTLPPLPPAGAAATTGGAASTPEPVGAGGAAAAPASGAAAAPSPQQLYEHVRRGVVALERNGVPVAIGTILEGDGRVLTSLSGLGGADTADILYADGTTVHAKVAHSDKGADLALLAPQSTRWTDGLAASEADPVGAPLRAMLPGHGTHLGPAEAGVKGRVQAHARDGESLASMLDVDVKGPLVAGAPLLDAGGNVVGVLVRACKGPPPPAAPTDSVAWAAWASTQDAASKPPAPAVQCTPTVVGAPVSTIRAFLARTAATGGLATTASPWLGIRGEPAQTGTVHGVRVLAVAPASPAEKGGLKPSSDIIIAADGHPIDTAEKLAETIGKHVPGDTVKLLVFGGDKFREVSIALRAAP